MKTTNPGSDRWRNGRERLQDCSNPIARGPRDPYENAVPSGGRSRPQDGSLNDYQRKFERQPGYQHEIRSAYRDAAAGDTLAWVPRWVGGAHFLLAGVFSMLHDVAVLPGRDSG